MSNEPLSRFLGMVNPLVTNRFLHFAYFLFAFLLFCVTSPVASQTIPSPQETQRPTDRVGRDKTVPRAPQLGTPRNEVPPRPPKTGLHLVDSFLPLRVGNRWTYEVELNGKKRPKPVVIEVTKMVISNFRSYYLFTRFPFAATEVAGTPAIRFDRKSQAFVQLVNDQEVELYPDEGDYRVEVQAGESTNGQLDLQILKIKFRSRTRQVISEDSSPPTDEIVFKYGEGIISAQIFTDLGAEKFTLLKSEVSVLGSGQGRPQKELAPSETPLTPIAPPTPYSKLAPTLELSVAPEAGKIGFQLRAINKQDKMTPLDFSSGQSFDFIVTSDVSDQPIWRWSANHVFTKVKRSIGLRPGESMEFSATWNGLDSNHHPVPAGKYRVVGVLAANPEVRTVPMEFFFTPPPAS
jgi:hypothetical protein